MYKILTIQDTSKGFIYTTILKAGDTPREEEGYIILEITSKMLHKNAIRVLLEVHRQNKKHNLAIDPNYKPRSAIKRSEKKTAKLRGEY